MTDRKRPNQAPQDGEKSGEGARKKDVFDKIMELPMLRLLEPFYQRNREVLLYLFFGVVTTLISWATFWFFGEALGWNEHIANPISWFFAVLVAFMTNRGWVFSAKTVGWRAYFSQMVAFYVSRLATLGAEELILFVFVTWLHFGKMPVKIAAGVVVIMLNYVLSKLFVFRRKP